MHIGFIVDGNRRYAKQQSLQPGQGHRQGAENLAKILEHLDTKGVEEVTLYVFSTENFKRSQDEIDNLMDLCREFFKKHFSAEKTAEKQLRVHFAGDISGFPKDIQEIVKTITDQTQSYSRRVVNLCFGYGGRAEIVRACQQVAQKVKEGLAVEDITEELLNEQMYISSQPDFIVRTGGAIRTSNFLPWQSVYSEWFFVEKFFPELTTRDIDSIIDNFQSRERRFGQ